MQATYRRDMNHNYLIIKDEEHISTDGYQVRMILGNRIAGLLPCSMQGMDGETYMYYEITSRQSMASYFQNRKYGIQDLHSLFTYIVKTMDELETYLLESDDLVLDPEYMYLDVETKEWKFCYLPGYQKNIYRQFRALTEQLLPGIEHQDQEAVVLGYGVYRKAVEEDFHMGQIKELLYQKQEDSEIITHEERYVSQKEQEHREALDAFFAEEEEESINGFPWPVFLIAFLAIVILFGIYFLQRGGYITWITLPAMILTLLIATGVAAIYLTLWTRKKGVPVLAEKTRQDWEKEFAKEIRETVFAEETSAVGRESISEDLGKDHRTVVLCKQEMEKNSALISKKINEWPPIVLKDELIIVGKLEGAVDVVIPNEAISRVHARIRKVGEDYFLTDLNSKNGTSVNGRMLVPEEQYCLKNEDEVSFANAGYVFLL